MAHLNGLFYSAMLAMSDTKGINELLEIVKGDPRAIDTLTMSEKTTLILFVAGLGMAVTFAVLVFLWFMISVVSKILASAEKRNQKPEKVEIVETSVPTVVEENEEDDEELIAVLAAAVAASLNTSIHNIIVKNVVRTNDHSPSWAKTGRIEQMNTRF
jgi:sodium pump decarboxylase gamma subunit